jgi:hypothetical protein
MGKIDKSKSSHDKATKQRKTDVTTEVIKTPKVEEKGPEQTVPPVDTDKPDEMPADTVEDVVQEAEPDRGTVQVLVRVLPRIRDKAKQEAELAYLYKWIPDATVSTLFTWLIDHYLDAGIKQFIAQRRGEQPAEAIATEDDSQGG